MLDNKEDLEKAKKDILHAIDLFAKSKQVLGEKVFDESLTMILDKVTSIDDISHFIGFRAGQLFDIPYEDVYETKKRGDYAVCRRVIIYLLKKYTNQNNNQIRDKFNITLAGMLGCLKNIENLDVKFNGDRKILNKINQLESEIKEKMNLQ